MLVTKLSEKIKKINIAGSVRFNVRLKDFTTFKTGGPADIFITASDAADIIKARQFAAENNLPVFILGGGANILVSDKGIRGITLYTGEMNQFTVEDNKLISHAGITVNRLAEAAMESSLSGFEFIYGMPGTVGGALWMNARCYGSEISQIFQWADVINDNNEIERIYFEKKDWAYKQSPFQSRGLFIYKCCFSLENQDKEAIQKEMNNNYNDRIKKGHFNAPCAGSIFKNNRSFGKPSGQIIDEAGLRGLRIGKAAVSDFHANIIINEGDAKASDILDLINLVRKKVKEQTGYDLEPEIIPVGEWR
ncbi:MAG: UDP-N-acetylmuramate dehydrogenase [Spirochaetaceae bacterium]|nr:UDP-N-acetylmuramate dehydrogenase [Spirochaetaceae bacterium]